MKDLRNTQGLLAFREIGGIGRKRRQEVLEAMGADEGTIFFEMLIKALEMRYISPLMPIGESITAWEKAEKIMQVCQENAIKITTIFDDDFPEILKFDDGPDLIYYQGDLKILDNPNRAAVIGTRAPSQGGAEIARKWGRGLAEADYTVISGLAAGCDTASHRGCLETGGKTVAFLPSAINQIVPRENVGLAEEIVASGGCLISEYSPLETVSAYMFIERDRLQSQTANFILTSEFAAGSGTLHTLNYAHDMGKTVYTAPEVVKQATEGFKTLTDNGIAYNVVPEEEFPGLFETLKAKSV